MRRVIAILSLLAGAAAWGQTAEKPPEFVALTSARGKFHPVFRIHKLPPAWTTRIESTTWHAGCPVPVSDLRALTVSYWDFQAKPETGLLVVNKATAKDLRWIFKKLFRHGFLIQQIEPIEAYGGNDERSMEANNTSAFNCRDITGRPGKFSNHSWGRAIDINPLTNPYLRQSIVLPVGGRAYLDRDHTYIGGILANSYIVRLFHKKGWAWGGDWSDRKDYQHFEKPVK